MSGEFNKQLKRELLPVTIPGGEFPKTGTIFGEIMRTDKNQNKINLETMKAAAQKKQNNLAARQ
jgi:hypothetical protein